MVNDASLDDNKQTALDTFEKHTDVITKEAVEASIEIWVL